MKPILVELGEFDAARFMQAWTQQLALAERPPHVGSDTATPTLHWHALAWAQRPPEPNHLPSPLAEACWGLLPGLHRLRLRAPSHPHVHTHLTLGIGPEAAALASLAHTPPPIAAVPDARTRVAVLGAGLAGAACARALAERGYRVHVLDAGQSPAAGASGLPVGLVAPHASPDDRVMSRLSRAGMRAMRDTMQHLLQEGQDWGDTGVQERRLPGKTRKGGAPAHWATDWPSESQAWTCAATDPHWPPQTLWHARGAWVRPSRLVQALLAHPLIQWMPGASATHVQHDAPTWRVMQDTRTWVECDQLILACGPATPKLLEASHIDHRATPIRPLRGQLSWGLMSSWPAECSAEFSAEWSDDSRASLPASPVNGNGSFVHSLPTDEGPAWFAGATFDRTRDTAECLDTDHADNLHRAQALLPELAPQLAQAFEPGHVRAWAAVRASVPDRLPMVGPVPHAPQGLWMCSAMGSRGLTLAMLCGELLAAQWCGEPLPVEPNLARALSSLRFIQP